MLAGKHWWWLAGGVVAFYFLRAKQVSNEVGDAVSGTSSNSIPVHLTDYHPFGDQTAASAQMEGGVHDRKGFPLHALEDYQAGSAPWVSVSADLDIFPYGQLINIDRWPGVPFRVVDTGSHFTDNPIVHFAHKVYRVAGEEPLDVCVRTPLGLNDSATMTVVVGDTLDNAPSAKQTANLSSLVADNEYSDGEDGSYDEGLG